jgi:hypothetical protein
MHPNDQIVIEVHKQLFPHRVNRNNAATGDARCALTEATLRG